MAVKVSVDQVDVLVIAALPEELAEAKAAGLAGKSGGPGVALWEERGAGGSAPYWWGEYRREDGRRLSVALARSTYMGARETAPIVTTLTNQLRPRCLAMCGVCAGNPDEMALGDVVVADPVHEWDEGKRSRAGLKGDVRQFRLNHHWLRAVQDFTPGGLPSYRPACDEDALLWLLERLHRGQDPRNHPARRRYFPEYAWRARLQQWEQRGLIGRAQNGLELTDQGAELVRGWLYDDVDGPRSLPFEVVAAPMASGSAVVADPGLWAQLQHMGMRKIAAVEMEAATVATVAHQHQVPYCLIAKGVMDHADSDKDDRYKRFAARASAEVLYALLAQLLPTAEADSTGHVPSIAPFVGIDDADIYGDGDPATTALQRDEYGAATTSPLPEFSQVIDYLSGHRIARVSGGSGTGKTTMAAMIGRDAARFDAAFYVDLASLNAPFSVTDTTLLLDRLTTLDEPGRLIVVDNTHLDERLERNIVNHWLATCGRGFMLLLSRRDEHDNRVPAVALTVSDRSLLAVWRRTDAFAHAALALPSDGALMKWKETFPDLVTFALAMRGSIGRLAADMTTLSQQDAVAFIRSRYLTGRSAEEEENLRLLATAGRYEFGLGPGSLVSNGLSKLVMEGLVHSGKRYYALGHPAVARLLLRALGVSTDSAALKQIAVTDPYAACGIASRLVQAGRRTDAARLLAQLVENGILRGDILSTFNLPNLSRTTRQLVDLGVARFSDIDHQLSSEQELLVTKVRQSPPPDVMHFLEFLKLLPRTADVFSTLLKQPAIRQEFIAWSYDAPVWSLLSVGMAARRFDDELSGKLLAILFSARAVDVAENLSRASSSDLGSCFRASEIAGRNAEFIAMMSERVGASIPEVVRHCIHRGPGEVIQYDAFLQLRCPELVAVFRDRVASAETWPELGSALANRHVGFLVRLLAWADTHQQADLSGRLEEVIGDRLRGDTLAWDLPLLTARDFANIFSAAGGSRKLGGALPAVRRCLGEHLDNVARNTLMRGLGEYVLLSDVLASHSAELAPAFRRQLLSVELRELAAAQARRVPVNMAVNVVESVRGWTALEASALEELLEGSGLAAAAADQQAISREDAATAGQREVSRKAIGLACHTSDAVFELHGFAGSEECRAALSPVGLTSPAVIGRYLVLASRPDFPDRSEALAAFAELSGNARHFALVGAIGMVAHRPADERAFWGALLSSTDAVLASPIRRSLLVGSAGRALAVARGLCEAEPGAKESVPKLCATIVRDWYSAVDRVTPQFRGMLYAYARDPGSTSPPLLPYQVVSMAHTLRAMGRVDAGLESKLVTTLRREVTQNASAVHRQRFAAWAQYSDIASATLA
ncbi:phosphorylase family protein [Streptomyces antibioticus]|uniref:phosphorylase family protein n=1 Tax=Streptomyces antibioticus TaxID=1890 RepID=UPI00339E7FDB